ncbi:MAG: SEC-C domain-containing protein [Vicinamibacteria bacterium]|nr:SEC-C domain-containing protein [Vicinamibacteria bacterium]
MSQQPGRNEPCPCGSGQKYKRCCLEKDEATAREARAQSGAQQESAPVSEGHKAPPPPKHTTQQPWKARQTRQGAPNFNIPRRSGGS